MASPAGNSSSTTCGCEVLGCASWSTALLVVDLKAPIYTRGILKGRTTQKSVGPLGLPNPFTDENNLLRSTLKAFQTRRPSDSKLNFWEPWFWHCMLFHGVIVLLQLHYCCLAPFDTTGGINSSLLITRALDVMTFIDVTPYMAFNWGDSSVDDVLSSLWITKIISVFHFAIISSLIVRLPPLHGLPFRFPCTGCAHFLQGRRSIPSSARCAGYIVMLVPSLRKWPVQARIKSLTVWRLVWPTFIVLRCDLISFLHKVKGKSSLTPG